MYDVMCDVKPVDELKQTLTLEWRRVDDCHNASSTKVSLNGDSVYGQS